MSSQPVAEFSGEGGAARSTPRRGLQSLFRFAPMAPATPVLARLAGADGQDTISGGANGAATAFPVALDASLAFDTFGAGFRERPSNRRAAQAALRRRIEPAAVEWGLRLADRAVLVISGLFALYFEDAFRLPFDLTMALAATVVLTLSARRPAFTPPQLYSLSRIGLTRQVAFASVQTMAPFALTALLVFSLPTGDADGTQPLLDLLLTWGFGAVIGIAEVRLALGAMALRWRDQGRLKEAVAIYGTGDVAERLVQRLAEAPANSIDLVGVFDDRAPGRVASPHLRSLVRGSSSDLIELSRQREIARVIVALPHAAEQRVLAVLNKLRHMPVEISLAPDLAGFNIPAGETSGVASVPLLAYYRRPLTFRQRLVKNAFDKAAAAVGLVLLSPLLLLVAVAIKLDSPGPVLYRQNRYGFGNRVIRIYKFRSMHIHADDPNGIRQAEANDPRITRLGRFLRRWSIDELPQLLNVLQGDMSLVGPRPHAITMRIEEKLSEEIIPDYALRHHLKPGITGWAQVNGYHGPIETEELLRARITHDLEYIEKWSLWFDIRTILLTFLCLKRRHAF